MGRAATREELEQALIREQADLAGVETRRADFEERLAYHLDRPGSIGPRLEEARSGWAHRDGYPSPLLTFEGFGDNALNLILRAYVGFIQRDLHLGAREPLRVRIEDGR